MAAPVASASPWAFNPQGIAPPTASKVAIQPRTNRLGLAIVLLLAVGAILTAITFVVRFWIPFVAKQADYLRAKSEAIERLKRAFDENGITMPFPIRTIEFAGAGPGEKAQS